MHLFRWSDGNVVRCMHTPLVHTHTVLQAKELRRRTKDEIEEEENREEVSPPGSASGGSCREHRHICVTNMLAMKSMF